MENLIYNELKMRGYLVDIGVVEINKKNKNGNYQRKQLKVDFVINGGNKRYYIQSATFFNELKKKEEEETPLKRIDVNF